MKKIFLAFITSIIILVGCNGNSNEHDGEAKTPSGSDVQKGRDYQDVVNDFKEEGFNNIKTEKLEDLITGWITKDGEVESVSVDGDKDYSPDVWYSNDVEVVITYHTFPEEKDNVEITDESNSESDDQKVNDAPEEFDQELITIENNEEFAAVLAVKDETDPIIGEFAKKYVGRTIEFDGYIANLMNYKDYNTRYNILIFAGNYREDTYSGPNFQFKDVNIVSDINLIGSNIPDTIGMGQNLRVKATVKEYDEKSELLLLEPVSTEIR
jgi:hypothetical protein